MRQFYDPQKGLTALARLLNADDYYYVLRSLYSIVLSATERQEDRTQLACRICAFELDCGLQPYLSKQPLTEFLQELEEAQYFYSLWPYEVSFEQFYQ